MRAAAAALGAAALLAAGPAAAGVFETYGFGARAASMSGAQAAFADDYSAVFYNPAALTVHKAPHVGTGIDVVLPRLRIDHDQPADEETPADRLPQSNVGVHLGLLFPLGGLIQNRFAVGVGLYLPTIQVTRVDATETETPHFYRYGSLPDKLSLVLGAAFELHDTVSIGVGYQFLGSLDGSAKVELDLLTQRFTRKNLSVDVHADSGLIAGLLVRPSDNLRLGFSFRDALQLRYDLITEIGIEGVGRLVADISGTSLYTPQQYTWAAAYDVVDSLTLTADLVWARWSEAPDPSAHFDIRLDGGALGLESIEADSAPVDLAAVDTLSPRVAVEWRPDPAWAVRAGYGFRPTPLPSQTGRANDLDSDTHQLAVGGGFSFADPLALHSAPVTIDLTAQLNWLVDRAHLKRAADDPVGDSTAGGAIWRLGLTLRHDFH